MKNEVSSKRQEVDLESALVELFEAELLQIHATPDNEQFIGHIVDYGKDAPGALLKKRYDSKFPEYDPSWSPCIDLNGGQL